MGLTPRRGQAADVVDGVVTGLGEEDRAAVCSTLLDERVEVSVERGQRARWMARAGRGRRRSNRARRSRRAAIPSPAATCRTAWRIRVLPSATHCGRAMESQARRHRRARIRADTMRDHARAMRARTLAALDQRLDTFTNQPQAESQHRAPSETGEDAVEHYIRRLARRGVRSIVKGKSMVSEEIELENPDVGGRRHRGGRNQSRRVCIISSSTTTSRSRHTHQAKEDCARVFKEKLGATDEEVVRRSAARRGACCGRRSCVPTWASPASSSASPRPAACASAPRRATVDVAAAHRDRGHGAAGPRRRPRRDAGHARAERHRPA